MAMMPACSTRPAHGSAAWAARSGRSNRFDVPTLLVHGDDDQIVPIDAAGQLDHLRHRERVTQSDRALQDRVWAFHRGASPPAVRHFIAPAR